MPLAPVAGEGPGMNVAFICENSPEGAALVTPPFDGRILGGITLERVLMLASRKPLSSLGLREIRRERVPQEMVAQASEVFLVGSTTLVQPVTEWDGRPIGDGFPGPVSARLRKLLEEDMATGDSLIPVDYSTDIQ